MTLTTQDLLSEKQRVALFSINRTNLSIYWSNSQCQDLEAEFLVGVLVVVVEG